MLLPQIYNSLDEENRKLFATLRASIRREYHSALATVAGAEYYDPTDDSILDALDIRLHSMFARGGRTKQPEKTPEQPNGSEQPAPQKTSIGSIAGVKSEDVANIEAQMNAAINEAPATDAKVPLTPWQAKAVGEA